MSPPRVSLILAVLVGCTPPGGDPNTDPSTSATTSTTSIGGSETGAGSGEASSTPTSGAGEGTGASGGVDTGAEGTGDATATTTGAETGGGPLCDLAGTRVSATLVPLDVPDVPDCGTIEFLARITDTPEPGVVDLDACGCEANCESPIPWRLSVDAPPEALPGEFSACVFLMFERVANADHTGCDFAALSVWNAEQSTPFGVYHAATRLAPTARAVDMGWQTASIEDTGCACDECCRPAALFDLTFGFEGTTLVELNEGQAALAEVTGVPFRFFDLQSHDAGVCDETEELDWVIRAEP